MKKKIIAILIIIPVLIAVFLGINLFCVNDDEIIFPIDVEELLSEKTPDFEQLISWQSEIEISGVNTVLSDKITCTVIAPDAASYIKDNMQLFENMDIEEFNMHISEAVKIGKMKNLSTEIVLPVRREGFVLIVETENNNEFKDASCGGLYSLYSELIVDTINNQEGYNEQN